MAQIRWWNFKDDDSTFRLNERDLTLMPHGLYAGFDLADQTSFNLVFNGSITGASKSDISGDITSGLSIVRTKQGAIIQEDGDITVTVSPIGTGVSAAFTRYDALVCVHNYVATIGGTTATYEIVQGTADTFPTKPTVSDYNKTIIGYLFQPAQNTDSANIVWIPNKPKFGDNPDNIQSNEVNSFERYQNIPSIRSEWGEANIDSSGYIRFDRNIAGTSYQEYNGILENAQKSFFILKNFNASTTYDAVNVLRLTFPVTVVSGQGYQYPIGFDSDSQTRQWHFISEQTLTISVNDDVAGNIVFNDDGETGSIRKITIEPYTLFTLTALKYVTTNSYYNDKFLLSGNFQGKLVYQNFITLGKVEQLPTYQRFNGVITFTGSVYPEGNIFKEFQGDSTFSVGSIYPASSYGSAKLGTVLSFYNCEQDLTILHNRIALTGTKNIFVPQEYDVVIPKGQSWSVVEDGTSYILLNASQYTSIEYSNSSGDITLPSYVSGTITARRYADGRVQITFDIFKGAGGGVNNLFATLPTDLRPNNTRSFDKIITGYGPTSGQYYHNSISCVINIETDGEIYFSNTTEFYGSPQNNLIGDYDGGDTAVFNGGYLGTLEYYI